MCKCFECGKEVVKTRDHEQNFCCTPCRTAWNNRRKLRGAEMYDLIMAMRFNRKQSKGLWAIMCRMASEYNAEDKEKGRVSAAPVRTVLERNVRYAATKHTTGHGMRRTST